jgi:hypothetical protein
MRGLPQISSFYTKSQVLKIHKHGRAFQGVSQQGVAQSGSFSKGQILTLEKGEQSSWALPCFRG